MPPGASGGETSTFSSWVREVSAEQIDYDTGYLEWGTFTSSSPASQASGAWDTSSLPSMGGAHGTLTSLCLCAPLTSSMEPYSLQSLYKRRLSQ